jgi:hypothetical protein
LAAGILCGEEAQFWQLESGGLEAADRVFLTLHAAGAVERG